MRRTYLARTRTPSFIDDPQAERRDYKGTPSGDYPDASSYGQEEGGHGAREHENLLEMGEECDRWRGGKMVIDTSDRRTASLGFNGLFCYDDGGMTLDVLLD